MRASDFFFLHCCLNVRNIDIDDQLFFVIVIDIFVFFDKFPVKVTQIHIIFDNHVQEGDWFISLYLLTIDDFVSIALLFIFFFFLSLFFKRFIPIFNLSLVYLHMVSDIFECKLVLNEDGISTCYGIQILVR